MVCFLDDLYIHIYIYIISYHIISYHIISYHIISYHIIYLCLRIEIQQGMISPASFRMISDLDLILAQFFFPSCPPY